MKVLLLVSGGTKTVTRLIQHPNLGVLLTPRAGNVPPPKGVFWACDNGCYGGFDEVAFRAMLDKIAGRTDCHFVTCPDVVGDSKATLELWYEWAPKIVEAAQSPAFVAQDGQLAEAIPWGRGVGAVFIGGSTRFKLGSEAARIVHAANRRNIWTHMGRVNTHRRIMFAQTLGVRSIDGSKFSRWSETYLPQTLDFMEQLDRQTMVPLETPW